jgi:hypothetical protein
VNLDGIIPVTGASCQYQPNSGDPIWTCGATFSLDALFGYGGEAEDEGEASCTLFPLPDIGLSIGLTTDPLGFASAQFSASTSGGGLEVSPVVVITGFSGGFELHPDLGINGSLTLGVGPPYDPECPTQRPFGIMGKFGYTQESDGDYELTLGGTLSLNLWKFSEQLVNATYTQQSVSGATRYSFLANAGLQLPAGISMSGKLDAELAGGGQWQLYVDGNIDAFGASVSGQGIASNIGAGGCATLSVGPWSQDVGFVYYWKSGQSDFGGCHLTALVSVPGSAAAASVGRRIRIPKGLSRIELSAQGASAPPMVELVSPAGQTVTAPTTLNRIATSGKVLALRVSSVDRTVFEIDRPAPGTWRLVSVAGFLGRDRT